MRLHRFYIEQPLGEELVVENVDVLHQITTVFRSTCGDQVIFFSPEAPGDDVTYTIETATKKQLLLRRVSTHKNIIPERNVTLCMALVKKDTFETIVRHTTELGITRIIPFVAQRSEKKNLNMERLQAIAIEAAEQCGRGNIPSIVPVMTRDEALAQTQHDHNILLTLAPLERRDTSEKQLPSKENRAVWVGPEGGWTDEEESLFKELGMTPTTLGATVLRAETAAIVGTYHAMNSAF